MQNGRWMRKQRGDWDLFAIGAICLPVGKLVVVVVVVVDVVGGDAVDVAPLVGVGPGSRLEEKPDELAPADGN